MVCRYEFGKLGGAAGSFKLGHMPTGQRVIGGWMQVDESPVGAGASVAIQVEAANDIVTAAAVGGAPWSTTGKKAITPKANTPESSSLLTTQDRDVVAVVSGGDLTAGKFSVYLTIQNAE
jgi:hypothetical protein